MDAITALKFQSRKKRKVKVPPPHTSQKPSIRIRMKPGAASRTPETALLLRVETAQVNRR